MAKVSIDDVSPQEWDAYNRKRIEGLKDPSLKNPKGMTDQDVENLPYNHETDHIRNVAKQLNNNVNSPSHYNSGSVECIEAIEAMLSPEEFIGYLRGNSLKYRWRFRYKGEPIEDLHKAIWYEERLLNFMEGDENVLGSKGWT